MFIRSLTIERFRGLERLEWRPPGRVNCLIGPGDAGKSTVLSAIELLLDPRPSPSTTEYDFFRRRVNDGFQITAVLGDLDEEVVSVMRTPPLHGWLGGTLTPLPDEDSAEPVLVSRVVASQDLELSHMLVSPGTQIMSPSPSRTAGDFSFPVLPAEREPRPSSALGAERCSNVTLALQR